MTAPSRDRMTLYSLKPRFLQCLRPAAACPAGADITANQVTLAAAAVSLVIGITSAALADVRGLFLLLPAWLLLRMMLNAIDGIIAREHNQRTPLGMYLNELGDVVSDVALYAPFAFVAPFCVVSVGVVIVAAVISELAGVLAVVVGADRRYDGPMGKSDRALVFATLAIWIATGQALPSWAAWLMPALAVLIGVTTFNRVRAGLRTARSADQAASTRIHSTPSGRPSP